MTGSNRRSRPEAPSAATGMRWVRSLALGSVLVALLTACAGGGDDAESGDSADAPAAGAPADTAGGAGDLSATDGDTGSEESAPAAAGDGSRGLGGAAVMQQAQLIAERKQILRADLVVQSEAVLTDARRAEAAVTALGGVITDEETQTDPGAGEGAEGYTVSTLTMRVPPERLNDLLSELSDLGTLLSQSRGTTDVTDDYVDVEARIASQRASLDRLLALVTDASDLDDVVALENEISRRQSDLDSLSARLQALDEQVTLATVSLTLTSAADSPVVVKQAGFMTGLQSGWDAFTGAVVGGLTVLGAILPFAVTLLLIGIPLYLLRNRRRTTAAPTPVTEPPAV